VKMFAEIFIVWRNAGKEMLSREVMGKRKEN
jgi:hypothetical protein